PGITPRPVGRICLVPADPDGRAGGPDPARPAGDADPIRRAVGADPLRVVETARYHAPVVIDAGSAALGGAAASVADRCVIVTGRDLEPALARVAAECVARVGPPPVAVLNRAPHDQRSLFALPNSPLGARL